MSNGGTFPNLQYQRGIGLTPQESGQPSPLPFPGGGSINPGIGTLQPRPQQPYTGQGPFGSGGGPFSGQFNPSQYFNPGNWGQEMFRDPAKVQSRLEKRAGRRTGKMSAQSMGGIADMVSGAAGVIAGLVGGRERREEEQAAKSMYQSDLAGYRAIDTSNPFANLTNPYEDLTVNMKQAEFESQQQQLGMATTMGAMRQAAGGSGIASLAQAMAGQQSVNLQRAAGSIGQQESMNARLRAQGEAQRQQLVAQGQQMSQQMEGAKRGQLLGLADQRLRDARAARAAATEQLIGGIGKLASGAIQTFGPGIAANMAKRTAGNLAKAKSSDRRNKQNIKLIGYSPSGLKIYAFEYINKAFGKGIYQGVMSDEIPQHAVIKHEDGFDRVDYSKLDVKFKKIKL